MQELERMINVYHTAYIVFLVLTIVLFCLTVFMFFKFDIRKIVDMKTGRGKKKSIQRMEEINAQTGKLRQEVADTPSRLKPEERITYPVTEQHLNVQVSTQDNRNNSFERFFRDHAFISGRSGNDGIIREPYDGGNG